MNDVVVNEVIYIDEKSYQQIKSELGKKNDYFWINEIKKYFLN